MVKKAVLLFSLILSNYTLASDYSYQKIAKRYSDTALTDKKVKAAKMQGECLVGLKRLNFKRKRQFDPIAEWTNYRSISLLGQYSPCEVLLIMEIAQKQLREQK
ncbi:hypothetical protein [Spartinivicinus poritis]|uniref:Uncharacterized protein n=1 Tax=Spartinivicinus poritis TaxID=2994640 RepID=A0ABT5UD02_9GAMM|nr:hypothetical protein [Spartinivicinus sp. A2-2]MDE1464258.1 hypothetical protein [Spartinivicinus sp. A2-2]